MFQKPEEKPDPGPPPEECRAEALSRLNDQLVGCLTGSQFCPFLLRYGYGLFCQHPRRVEIVKRTQLNP